MINENLKKNSVVSLKIYKEKMNEKCEMIHEETETRNEGKFIEEVLKY